MGKGMWIFFTLIAIFMTVMVAINKNAHQDLRPFLGKWTGAFVVDPPNKRENLDGFLQMYATEMMFKMHLEGEQQEIDVDGNWAIEGKQIILKPTHVDIQDYGGQDVRNPNLAYIPNDDVRAAYERTLVFNPSADKKKLDGLLISIGPLRGAHQFTYGGSGG